MKNLKITMVLITTAIFSGCTTCVNTHIDFVPGEQCVFERLTESEKSLMSEDTKMKIGRNYKGCFIRQSAENKRIDKHNKLNR